MSTQAAVLQLHQRDTFERNVTRALLAGAGAGAVAFASHRVGLPIPLSYLVLAGTALCCVRGDKLDRLLLAGLSVVVPGVPWLFGLTQGWTVALGAAGAGAVMVRARLCDKGEEGSLGSSRPGLLHYGLAAVGVAGLTVAGLEVAKVLTLRLSALATPPLLTALFGGVVLALFAAIGSIAAHLALRPDPVEARCEELIPQLTGELQTQATRALALYRQCGESLALLPRQPAREELARTLGRMTKDAVELAAEWSGVEAQLEDEAQKGLSKEIADLHKSAKESTDAVARRQLEAAAASLEEELTRVGQLQQRRERIVAKLRAEVALLERARVALIGMRSGQAQIKAAELTALARKLSALATAQADEAKLMDEVATGAELAAHEASAQRVMEPVAPIAEAPASEPAPTPVAGKTAS